MFWLKSKEERKLDPDDRKECIEKMLKETFPMKLYVLSFVLNILFSAAAIGFQYLAVVYESPNYFVYAGFINIYKLFMKRFKKIICI